MRFHILTFLFLILTSFALKAEIHNDKTIVYQININQEIGSTSRLYLTNGMRGAQEKNADLIIINLNTYGGLISDADSMRSAILYSEIPVYVFINNNAASAGALISVAAKGIYMREGANIGAATVVDPTGNEMPDKYQSYMRSIIRATAESHGKIKIINGKDTTYKWKRDPHIAEAMVDNNIYIPNLIDSGKVLTLTSREAMEVGFCDGIAESVDEVITKYLHCNDYEKYEYKPSLFDNIKGFLLNPAFQAVLIMIIIAGIYFELQSPGVGFPGIAALTAVILYFAPLYIDGLAQYWEIGIFIIGTLLIVLELFAFPGFGVAGISGIVLVLTGLILSLLANDQFSLEGINTTHFLKATLTVLSGALLGFIIMFYLSSRIGKKGIFKKIALEKDLESYQTIDPSNKKMIGKTGIASTVLRPSGKITIESDIYDAISEDIFIEKDEKIIVTKFENMQLYVKKLK